MSCICFNSYIYFNLYRDKTLASISVYYIVNEEIPLSAPLSVFRVIVNISLFVFCILIRSEYIFLRRMK
jgi:hypothetical protein